MKEEPVVSEFGPEEKAVIEVCGRYRSLGVAAVPYYGAGGVGVFIPVEQARHLIARISREELERR